MTEDGNVLRGAVIGFALELLFFGAVYAVYALAMIVKNGL